MRYILSFFLIFLLLLSSCSSMSSFSTKESDTTQSEETIKEEKEALLVLAEDMVVNTKEVSFKSSLFGDALREEYKIYEKYLPSYSDIKARYLSSVAEVVNETIANDFPQYVLSIAEELANNPTVYVEDGVLITDTLENVTRDYLSSLLFSALEENSEKLSLAFGESKDACDKIKTAYSNLILIGEEVDIPRVKEIDYSRVVSIALDKYYSILKEEEEKLRNNPVYANPSYKAFWS